MKKRKRKKKVNSKDSLRELKREMHFLADSTMKRTNDIDFNVVRGNVSGSIRAFADICSRVLSRNVAVDDLRAINLFVTVWHPFPLQKNGPKLKSSHLVH